MNEKRNEVLDFLEGVEANTEANPEIVATLGKGKSELKRPKKFNKLVGVLVVVVLGIFVFLMALYLWEHFEGVAELTEYVKSLEIEVPEGANVTYGSYFSAERDGWKRVKVWFKFEEPWKDYTAWLWFNRDTDEFLLRTE